METKTEINSFIDAFSVQKKRFYLSNKNSLYI